MRRFRFSIAGLMAIVITVALGLAALRSASALWVKIIFNLTTLALLAATYKARCCKGVEGAWWTGFAAFGWAHLVVGLVGMPFFQYEVEATLVTEEVELRVFDYLFSGSAARQVTANMSRLFIAHCLVSLLLALMGGGLFGVLARRKLRTESRAGEGTPASL